MENMSSDVLQGLSSSLLDAVEVTPGLSSESIADAFAVGAAKAASAAASKAKATAAAKAKAAAAKSKAKAGGNVRVSKPDVF